MDDKAILLQRYSALIPLLRVKDAESLVLRSLSANIAIAHFSAASSTNEYVGAKIERISTDLAMNGILRECYKDADILKFLTREEYRDATRELHMEVDQQERELTILKRQRKTISDDVYEVLPRYSTMEGAYSSILMAKIVSASGMQRKGGQSSQRIKSEAVLSFYGAVRERDVGDNFVDSQRYCHIFGWLPEKSVNCVHLVPKCLESDELAYLFGVREVDLSEPRNSMLHLFNPAEHVPDLVLRNYAQCCG